MNTEKQTKIVKINAINTSGSLFGNSNTNKTQSLFGNSSEKKEENKNEIKNNLFNNDNKNIFM